MIRIVAFIGVLLTLGVTAALALDAFAAFVDGGNSSFTTRSLPAVLRMLTLAGLLWTPAVAAKLVNPEVTFREHWHVTFDNRTVWGVVVFAGVVATAVFGAITGGYWWFAFAVLAQLLWGFRSGVRT